MDRHRKPAFSLIELLVVVAIIALLVMILTPTLDRANELARRAVCASRLHQISIGTMTYAGSRQYWLPGPVRENKGRPFETFVGYWRERFDATGKYIPYNLALLYEEKLIGDPRVFYCPNQTGTLSYDHYPKPWSEGLADYFTAPPHYLWTGYWYLPYAKDDFTYAGWDWQGQRPERLTDADPKMMVASEFLNWALTEVPSPHVEHYWNFIRFDGSVDAAVGSEYVAGLPWPHYKYGELSPSGHLTHDWVVTGNLRERMVNKAPDVLFYHPDDH
jgi:prepilin-type N-terminal cleavage/methylation domain-containing protein